MIKKLVLCLLIFSSEFVFSQKNKIGHFDEFHISLNKSIMEEGRILNFGYGFGIKHGFNIKPSFSFILGVEYNQSILFHYRKKMDVRWVYVENMKNTMRLVSIPILFRKSFNKKIYFFFEGGWNWEINAGSSAKGILFSSRPNNYINGKEFDDKINIKSTGAIQIGGGVSFPYKKILFFLQSDYKYSLGIFDYDYSGPLDSKYIRLTFGIRNCYFL